MMNDYGIKPEWKEAWQYVDKFDRNAEYIEELCEERYIADLAAHLLAKLKESEFRREHEKFSKINLDYVVWLCQKCDTTDPRHTYEYPDWLRVARGELQK